MKNESFPATRLTAISIAAATLTMLTTSTAWSAGQLKTLHIFGGRDGEHPNGSLTSDRAGNLYGTASAGGERGFGNIFKLTPSGNGQWTETVLHDFNSTDGAYPQSSLIFDRAGNLYGTTSQGGSLANGTVFKLAPAGQGKVD